MHMNSAPHLLNEDRQEYERVLDEALRSAPHHADLAAIGRQLNAEQLRTMALNATALITAAAATEYQHYVKVRDELREPAQPGRAVLDGASRTDSGSGAVGLATATGEVTEPVGAGAIAVVAVLTPVLAGTAAAIFLLVGYVLKALDPREAFAHTLLTTGWVFTAITAAAILVAAVGLLLTALRNGSTSLQADEYNEHSEAVDQAREAWHQALLERGILPFLREALADPDLAPPSRPTPAAPTSRIPHLGYNRPGFSSPEGGPAAGPRPSYSSPDFTSPDFGGPEHKPE
ncbi:hypothetical protein ABT009_09480 [Streptomyces sp. NPDC002896]|uniref:hypothetical protein n=1 Tax=Streptomyces sp. NPDC002896 TaxID=3154438 RepID=UPI003316D535